MHTIVADNVNEALQIGMMSLRQAGMPKPSRNGPTIEYPAPVCTTYRNPWRRVLFDPLRDANPYFHFMESLWMLAGRNDVRFLSQYNSRIKDYSDDGIKFNGAYGHRMRVSHGDQLGQAIDLLRADPNTRRCVVQIWDADNDNKPSKDIPCNDMLMFLVRNGRLDMSVCCRSNDVIWGAYGANAVHFSIIHEYVAFFSRLPLGTYHQISNSYHVYESNPYWQEWTGSRFHTDLYTYDEAMTEMPQYSLFNSSDPHTRDYVIFDMLLAGALHQLSSIELRDDLPLCLRAASVMDKAWWLYKLGDFKLAYYSLDQMPVEMLDWKRACIDWLMIREAHTEQRKQ